MRIISYVEALREALRQEMEYDSSVIVMGEDVGPLEVFLKLPMVCGSNSVMKECGIPNIGSSNYWSGRWRCSYWPQASSRTYVHGLYYNCFRSTCKSSRKNALYVWW
jgi:hypothetical protein